MVDYKLVEAEPTPPPPEVHLIMSTAEATQLRKLLFWAYRMYNSNSGVSVGMASALEDGTGNDIYKVLHEATTGREGHLG